MVTMWIRSACRVLGSFTSGGVLQSIQLLSRDLTFSGNFSIQPVPGQESVGHVACGGSIINRVSFQLFTCPSIHLMFQFKILQTIIRGDHQMKLQLYLLDLCLLLQKYVLSAAHCFCATGYGFCTKNNSKKGKRLRSGHFRYLKRTKQSRQRDRDRQID